MKVNNEIGIFHNTLFVFTQIGKRKKDTEVSLFADVFITQKALEATNELCLFRFGKSKIGEITVDKSLIWLDLDW